MVSRKKPGVGFWATVVVVVALIGYPLSIGPACWLDGWLHDDAEVGIIGRIYYPIIWVASVDPSDLTWSFVERYSGVGRRDRAWPALDLHGELVWCCP